MAYVDVLGRDRLGFFAEHAWHEPIWRRRTYRHEEACPFTTLYWDFLARHQRRLAKNPRMKYPYMNFLRKDAAEVDVIRKRAAELKARLTAETFL